MIFIGPTLILKKKTHFATLCIEILILHVLLKVCIGRPCVSVCGLFLYSPYLRNLTIVSRFSGLLESRTLSSTTVRPYKSHTSRVGCHTRVASTRIIILYYGLYMWFINMWIFCYLIVFEIINRRAPYVQYVNMYILVYITTSLKSNIKHIYLSIVRQYSIEILLLCIKYNSFSSCWMGCGRGGLV